MERNLLFALTSLIFIAQKVITYRWKVHMIIYELIIINSAAINIINTPKTVNFRKPYTIYLCMYLQMFHLNQWGYSLNIWS